MTVELTVEEALVLFEFLSRTHQERSLGIEDASERFVLWELEARLEGLLGAVDGPEFAERLERARAALRASGR